MEQCTLYGREDEDTERVRGEEVEREEEPGAVNGKGRIEEWRNEENEETGEKI